jgi:hypothetical protein
MARKLGDKDKVKRKSRGLLTNSALLGGATALGGYLGGRDSKVNTLMKNNLKKADKMWEVNGWKKDSPDKYKELIAEMKGKEGRNYAKERLDNIEAFSKRFPKTKTARLNNKLNKIRRVSIGKGALIGAGIGTALLGANELRNRMSKKK